MEAWMEITKAPEDSRKNLREIMNDDISGKKKIGLSPYFYIFFYIFYFSNFKKVQIS